MNYNFSFDKKSAILVLVGCMTIGVLLFLAGYILGLARGQSQTVVQANSVSQNGQTPTSKQQQPAAETVAPASAEKSSPAPALKETPKDPQESANANATDKKSSEAAGEPSQSAKAAAPDKDKSTFSLQLGAFQTEANALKLRNNLRAKGYPVFLFRVQDANGNVWNTVRMGHYADMKEASHAAAQMTGKEQISAWVRPSNAF
jgi:cell division septation protein DedD